MTPRPPEPLTLRAALDDPETFGWTGPPTYAIAYAAAIRDVKAFLASSPAPAGLEPWLRHKMNCASTEGYGEIDGVRLTPQKPCDCGLAAAASSPAPAGLDVEEWAEHLHDAFHGETEHRYVACPHQDHWRGKARALDRRLRAATRPAKEGQS